MLSLIKRHQIVLTALFLILLSFQLINTNLKGVGGDFIVKRMVFIFAYPIQTSATYVKNKTLNIWNGYINLINVNQENERLIKVLSQQELELTSLTEEIKKYRRQRTLNLYSFTLPYKNKTADVIGQSAFSLNGTWTRTVKLNRGTNSKIDKDTVLMTHQGLVGKIIETDKDSSLGLLITDPRSRIDVTVQRSRVKGILQGNSSHELTLKYIRNLDSVKVGDKVITAGLNKIFPKGIIIGIVSEVTKDSNDYFQKIKVTPSAKLRELEEILLVKK